VGCGKGEDVLALAEMVGPSGRVVGIDSDKKALSEAKKRFEKQGSQAVFQAGDAHCLDFKENTFNSCRADRVFQYLENPGRALAEMKRVTCSGGRVLAADPDWETLVINAPDRILTRKILNHKCDRIRHGWCGRRLRALFKKAGLQNIRMHTKTLILTDFDMANQLYELEVLVEDLKKRNTITREEALQWLDDLTRRSDSGYFFSAITGFIAVGQKP
jgi:SAM-dependent methyltransferase